MRKLLLLACVSAACRYGFDARQRASEGLVATDATADSTASDGLTLLSADAAPDGPINASIDASRDASAAVDGAAIDPIGCADGTREGFADLALYPTIAGCAAQWTGAPSLRAPATSVPCGNGLGSCVAPADACSPGWHACGASGDPAEVSTRATTSECDAAGGSTQTFVAATSHCEDAGGQTCGYVAPYACLSNQFCAEPVCCGSKCGHKQMCTDGVYTAGRTRVYGTPSDGCGSLPSSVGVGVLCCL